MSNLLHPEAGDVVIWTHDGPTNADEILATAIIKYLNPMARVVRSRDVSANAFANFTLDVGRVYNPSMGAFDHHQSGFRKSHPEGFKKATAGLVWDAMGGAYMERLALVMARDESEEMCDLHTADLRKIIRTQSVIASSSDMVRKGIILPTDAWDNGVFPDRNTPVLALSSIVAIMGQADKKFEDILPMVETILLCVAKSAIAKTLRSRVLAEHDFDGQASFLKVPVRPYSIDWVRKSATKDLPGLMLAYYLNPSGEEVDWTCDKAIKRPSKGRSTVAEFLEMFQLTEL